MPENSKISFIIPCHNEERFIVNTLSRIKKETESNRIPYEIIVVDNLSTDNSVQKIKDFGIVPVVSAAETVSEVRNQGFTHATGDILVFLDADVYLGDGWGAQFKERLRDLVDQRYFITGSHCSVPDNIRQPLLSWYKGIEFDERNTHLGTGHMIIHRDLFLHIGKFDKNLRSGEDFELCRKAKRIGANIINDKSLIAFHMGYPDRIFRFVEREQWHGVSDLRSVKTFLGSKVAVFSAVFAVVNVQILISIILLDLFLFLFSCAVLVSLLFISVIKKFGVNRPLDLFYKICASYFYFFGRALSFLYIIKRGVVK